MVSVYNSISAMNDNGFVNSTGVGADKIKTSKAILPVLYENVLHYEPGELGNSALGVKGADILYTKEALQDPEFLESVLASPISVGTHDKNTNEYNIDINGWSVKAFWDEAKKAVLTNSYLKGKDNVDYVKENKDVESFGTSAYVDFLELVEESGTTSDGKRYTAKATKLKCNHLAILPNIRDKHNVIVAMNSESISAMNAVTPSPVTNDEPKKETVLNKLTNILRGKNNMADEKDAVKDILNEIDDEKKKEEEYENLKNTVKSMNERLDKMDAANKAKNEEPKEDEKKEEKKDEPKAENADDDLIASNALPSQELIGKVQNALGVTFKETPSITVLAKMLGVKKDSFAETLSALNAKCKEIETTSAKNSSGSDTSDFDKTLREI